MFSCDLSAVKVEALQRDKLLGEGGGSGQAAVLSCIIQRNELLSLITHNRGDNGGWAAFAPTLFDTVSVPPLFGLVFKRPRATFTASENSRRFSIPPLL